MNKSTERNSDSTVFIGNIDDQADSELIYELFVQTGPLKYVFLPRDKVNGQQLGYAFAEYVSEKDAEYTAQVMNQVRLFGKPLKVNKSAGAKKDGISVGADLYISGLDSLVDEKVLYDTFNLFGAFIKPPVVVRDTETGQSRGFGFVFFDNFDSADRAIAEMDSQYLMNKPIKVSYALKNNGKGEHHGDQAERLLSDYARKHNYKVLPGDDREGSLSATRQGTPEPPMVPPPFGQPNHGPQGVKYPPPPPGLR